MSSLQLKLVSWFFASVLTIGRMSARLGNLLAMQKSMYSTSWVPYAILYGRDQDLPEKTPRGDIGVSSKWFNRTTLSNSLLISSKRGGAEVPTLITCSITRRGVGFLCSQRKISESTICCGLGAHEARPSDSASYRDMQK